MRLGCGANQEAIANVTRTRCDRRAVEAEQLHDKGQMWCRNSREDSERCLAEKLVESRPRRAGGRGPVSDAVGCEGGLRCQATGRAMCRRAGARLARQ